MTQFTTFREEVDALSNAIRHCSSISVIEAALMETMGPGDNWPQGGDYCNPSFALTCIELLKRQPQHARIAVEQLNGG